MWAGFGTIDLIRSTKLSPSAWIPTTGASWPGNLDARCGDEARDDRVAEEVREKTKSQQAQSSSNDPEMAAMRWSPEVFRSPCDATLLRRRPS